MRSFAPLRTTRGQDYRLGNRPAGRPGSTLAACPSCPSRTQRILEAPVLPLLLSLAAPNIGEAAARITFLTADALFVSWLGSDALAGVAVVFPLFLILQTATASGIGSGVSSAIGRALGAGEHARRPRSPASPSRSR